jgi:phage-related protein
MNHEKMVKEREEKMSEEEMKKATEEYAKECEAFLKNLKDNPDAVITNKDLSKAIEYIFNDVGGIAQMTQMLSQNMAVLNKNFNAIIQAIQGNAPINPMNKTKSGIILP